MKKYRGDLIDASDQDIHLAKGQLSLQLLLSSCLSVLLTIFLNISAESLLDKNYEPPPDKAPTGSGGTTGSR